MALIFASRKISLEEAMLVLGLLTLGLLGHANVRLARRFGAGASPSTLHTHGEIE